MATYFPPLLETAPTEGYAKSWTVRPEHLPQHQHALQEIQTDPAFIAHLQWMKGEYCDFTWIDPRNPSTYSLKFLQEADRTVRINVKAHPTDIGKHVPLDHRFARIHALAAFLLGVGAYPAPEPATPTARPVPMHTPRAVSRGCSPLPFKHREEEERPRALPPEFEAMQEMVREQQAQIAEQGKLVVQLTQFIQAQAEQNQKAHAEQLGALERANADAIKELKAAHASSMAQFQRMHDDSREDLLAAMGDMQRQYQAQLKQLEQQRSYLAEQIGAMRDEHRNDLQTLRQEQAAQLDRVEKRNASTMRALRQDHAAQTTQMTEQHAAQMTQLTEHNAAQMQAERDQRAASEKRFTQALETLGERSDQRLADAQRHSDATLQRVAQDAGRWRRTVLRQAEVHQQQMAQQFAAYRDDMNARFKDLQQLVENLHPAPSLEDLSAPASPRANRSPTPELEEPEEEDLDDKSAAPSEQALGAGQHSVPPAQGRELLQEFSEENGRLYEENLRLHRVELQFQVLSERVPDLEAQILELERIRTRYSQAERLLGQLAPMEQELANLRRQICQKDSDLRQMGEAIRNVHHYRAQAERLAQELDHLQQQRAIPAHQLEQLQAQLDEERQRREDAEGQLGRLRTAMQGLQETILQMQDHVEESDARWHEAVDELAAAEQSFAQQREQLEAQMEETRQTYLEHLGTFQRERDEALENLRALQEEVDGHVFAREAAEEENRHLEHQLRQANSLLALQEGHLQRLEARTAQLTFLLFARQSWLQRLNQPFAPRQFRSIAPRPLPQIELHVPEPPHSEASPPPEQREDPPFDPSFDDFSRLFHYHIPRPLGDFTPSPLAAAPMALYPGFLSLYGNGSPLRMPYSVVGSQMLLNGNGQRPRQPFFGITSLLYPGLFQQTRPQEAEESVDLSNVILTGDTIDDGVNLHLELERQRRERAALPRIQQRAVQTVIPFAPNFGNLFANRNLFPFAQQFRQPSYQQPQGMAPSLWSGQRPLPRQREFHFSPPVVTDISDQAPDLHAFTQRPAPRRPQQQQQTPPPSASSFSGEDFFLWAP